MFTLAEFKNFLREHWGYILLTISSTTVLGFGVYYIFFEHNNNQNQLITTNQNNQNGQEKKSTRKNKLKKISFLTSKVDPIIDNGNWLIASFIVYSLVYLLFRWTGNGHKTIFAIPAAIILWKVGLAAFSSHRYKQNNFLQNLIRSLNPTCFFQQNPKKTALSLIYYGTITVLIYYDFKKAKADQNDNNDHENNHLDINLNIPDNNVKNNKDNNNNNSILNNEEGGKENLEEPKMNQTFNSNIPPAQPPVQPVIQIPKNENVENVKENFFAINRCAYNNNDNGYKDAMEKITTVRKLLNYEDFINSIIQGIESGAIDANGIQNLISKTIQIQDNDNKNYYLINQHKNFSFLNSFLFITKYFVEEDDNAALQFMVENFLDELMKEPSNAKIKALKETVNELYYLFHCVKNFCSLFFSTEFYFQAPEFKLNNVDDIQRYHFELFSYLIKNNNCANLFKQKMGCEVDQCKKEVWKLHDFLIKYENSNKITTNSFIKAIDACRAIFKLT